MKRMQIQWIAPDFKRATRRDAWQSASLFCAFVLGIVAFIERSIPFFIAVLFIEFILLVAIKRFWHVEAEYWLTEVGLWMGEELICTRGDISQFAVTDHGEEKIVPWSELIFLSRAQKPRLQKMLIPHEEAPAVRLYLAQTWETPEFEYQPGALESLRRIFRLDK